MAYPPPTEVTIPYLLNELERREMETAALTRVIRSPSTAPDRRVQAVQQRDELQEEWVSIIVQLDALGHQGSPIL